MKLRDVTFVSSPPPIYVRKRQVLEDPPPRYGDVINGWPLVKFGKITELQKLSTFSRITEITQ